MQPSNGFECSALYQISRSCFAGLLSTLIVIVLAQKQHIPPALIGVLFALGGAGYAIGTLLGASFQRWLRLEFVILGVCWLFVLLWPLFAVAASPLLLAAVLLGLSLLWPIYGVAQVSYRLTVVPDELQGRVTSIYHMIAFGFRTAGTSAHGSTY